MNQLLWAEGILLVLVLIFMPIYSYCVAKWHSVATSELRGLNMPRGSIRGMLALMSVGSFIIVLVFGSQVPEIDFQQVVTAFGTLTGAVIGFYFGSRSASPKPEAALPPQPEANDK